MSKVWGRCHAGRTQRLDREAPRAAPRPAGPLAEAALTARNPASRGQAAGLHGSLAAAKSMPGCTETGWESLSGDCQVYESPQCSSSQRSRQLEKQFSKDTLSGESVKGA